MYPVHPGDKIQISASEWNVIVETTRTVQQLLASSRFGKLLDTLPENIYYGIPEMDVTVGDVVAVNGFRNAPQNPLDPPNTLVANIVPAAAADLRPLAVALEPLKQGQTGRFQLAGVTLAKRGKCADMTPATRCAAADGAAGLVFSPAGLKVFAYTEEWLLVSLDAPPSAGVSGMFTCRLLPPRPADLPEDFEDNPNNPQYSASTDCWAVICYNSLLPDYEMAGVATVNGQQFDVERMIFELDDARVHRVELKFTAPKQGIGEEGDENYVPPEDAKCEVVLLTDKEEDEEDDPYDEEGNRFVESTPDEMYYLIALIVRDDEEDEEDEGEEKEVSYSMDQAHTPGPIFMTWYGTCIDLLQERLQTGVPIPVPPQ